MEQQSKKRSIFGFTGLFRSSAAPADNRDDKMDASTKPVAPASAQRESNTASAPHSPMKRASETQLASRRIIGRPQGPSSKLSQSISASDIAHRPSSLVVGPPRRMPGDNPNKRPPAVSASGTSHAPSNVIPKSTSFSGVSSTPRNIFRSSALYSRPGQQTFSSRVPANTLTQSFPPTTPGKPPHGSTPDVNGRILANTSSTELFKMRIPSPPRHLTGEVLAKEVPDDPNRSGSIYADEFLAHYCPPDFDDYQRRQFFCILDLRRLKYAADEVFTKKDWKINILNFAKEYEKSRSLIMLRYGLYEFKTVRASEAVKKEWKQKHGIPESDDESGAAPKTNGTSKRKAEEELTPESNTLTASISGANKRPRAPESPAKNKRKADVEPDENQPAKLQKPAPSSATKSVFESIANKDQPASGAAAKPAGKSLFASSMASKPNGSLGSSIFGTTPKPTSTTGNIFGHLSDGSKGSGNDGADEESDSSSEAEEQESEAQDVSQSDEAAASGGTSTPQLLETKKPTTNGISSASSDAGESSQGRSIFDRITRDPAGQPVRKLTPGDGNLFAAPSDKERTSFGGGSSSGPVFTFGASSQPSSAPIFSQNPPAAQSIFGNSLAPGGGTSTGTNSPFTFGGASSLATTPAATTPEPSANAEDGQGTNADGDDAPQEQISLTGGGPGEEDESVVHEVRAKAVKLVTGSDSDDDSGSNADKAKKNKSPWKVQGVGPLRLLKNKTTGAVRMLLRAEPRGHVALNKAILPDFNYKAEAKYVKVTTATDDGKGLETWMLQVKTPASAQALAEALEEHKKANKK
ncbi:hypothetical protein MYCTH_107142 [Thermothelomyces thermophilus ATCC 42464]|uniref:RanBD1 domain-containing protein n=1 Tax=Thermothelomyces thermophilus (strain ATCC 42464 / BCRC 31852 / DSM 1799) TaxID=573729 RepID=G2Q7D5_THET4|nr:uncharacterized protein MYCTH_107142 [Thermothelomyces thermophilus ATCC 42464]AEO56046.1 hypothetical protein MYCTH_107142 [Thermothelomyces thermophilus ATCC 42464]